MGFMTLSDFESELSLNLSGRATTPQRLRRWIHFAHLDLASREKFEELRVEEDLPIIAGTSSYAIPTGYIGLVSLTVNGRRVRKTRRIPIGERTGAPAYWLRREGNIEIWPEPNVNYTARIEYVKEPTRLTLATQTTTFPGFYDVVILNLAIYYALMALGEKDNAITYLNIANEYLERRIDDGNIEADVAKEGLQVARSWDDLVEDPPHY